MVKEISPARSFKGWEFKKWFVGNWSTIKEIGKVGAPLLVGYLTTHNPYLIGFITILGKFLLDSGEFWYKRYTS